MRLVFGIFVSLIGIAMVIAGILYPPTVHTYSGKIAFYSESEYSVFKTELANSNITYKPSDISVLSSEPPIVVNFTVSVGDNAVFPYGKIVSDGGFNMALPIFVGAAVIVIGVMLIISHYVKE